jgi:hypothetical protein
VEGVLLLELLAAADIAVAAVTAAAAAGVEDLSGLADSGVGSGADGVGSREGDEGHQDGGDEAGLHCDGWLVW